MEAGLIEGWIRGGDDELELEEVLSRHHGRVGELLALAWTTMLSATARTEFQQRRPPRAA
jgi:hypothetical protein